MSVYKRLCKQVIGNRCSVFGLLLTTEHRTPFRLIYRLLITFTLLVTLALPKQVLAHVIDAPAELIRILLEGELSGPFTISASQYATETFTELEVQLAVFGAVLPEDTAVKIEAISAETNQSYSASLIRHHDMFSTTLPLNGEDWQVTVTVESSGGSGSAELTVIPWRAPVETPPIIRYLTFGSPFILGIVFILATRLFGFSIFGDGKQVQ